MKRKIVSIVMASAMVFGLAACGSSGGTTTSSSNGGNDASAASETTAKSESSDVVVRHLTRISSAMYGPGTRTSTFTRSRKQLKFMHRITKDSK